MPDARKCTRCGQVLPNQRHGLSPIQQQVVAGIVDGLKYKEIAKQIERSEQTTKTYVRDILTVTGMGSRTELAVWWVQREHEEQTR